MDEVRKKTGSDKFGLPTILENFFYYRRFNYSVISTAGRDLRLNYNQGVQIDAQLRNLRTHPPAADSK